MSRDTDISWAAGLFEGEGSIVNFLNKHGYYSRSLSLGMVDEDVVAKFVNVVGAGSYRRRTQSGRRDMFVWKIGKWVEIERVLKMFLPYFGERRSKAALELLFNPARTTPGRPIQTHCKRGHELAGSNLYVPPGASRRVCRACQVLAQARYQQSRTQTSEG